MQESGLAETILLICTSATAGHSSTLAWKIPWMEGLVGCSPWGLEESDMTERLHFHFHFQLPETSIQLFSILNPHQGTQLEETVVAEGLAASRVLLSPS